MPLRPSNDGDVNVGNSCNSELKMMSDARRARRLCIPNQIASADEAAGATRDEDDAAAAEGGGRGGSSTVHASSAREVPHSMVPSVSWFLGVCCVR